MNTSKALLQSLTAADAPYRMEDGSDFMASVNFSTSQNLPVHRWFRYREGFSPKVLSLLPQAGTVFDPLRGFYRKQCPQ